MDQIHRIMAYAAAKAYYQRGHYDRAEQLIDDYRLIESQDIEGLILFFKIKWAQGDKQQTIEKLEDMLNRISNSDRVMGF